MKRVTHREFKQRLAAVFAETGISYRQLDRYKDSQTKLRFLCKKHGEFLKLPNPMLNGDRCQKCSQEQKLEARKAGLLSEYNKILAGRKLELLEELRSGVRLNHKCLVCAEEFLVLKSTVVNGGGCPICKGLTVPKTRARHTEATYNQEFQKIHNKVQLKNGTFSAMGKAASFVCSEHGEFKRRASDALRSGCPQCAKSAAYATRVLATEECQQRIRDKHGDKIRLMGQYVGSTSNRRYRFKCYVCFNTWKAQIHSVTHKGTGCPHCGNQRKTKAGFRVKEFERDGVIFRVQGWEYQAICWILDKKTHIKAADILTESSSKVPVIRYKFGRRYKNYYPDMIIPRLNLIIEVKSNYTLGLTGSKRSLKMWRQNQAKAKATLEAGYRYILMVMREDGTRVILPKLWYSMSHVEVLTQLALRNGSDIPRGTPKHSSKVSPENKDRLKQDILEEIKRSKAVHLE